MSNDPNSNNSLFDFHSSVLQFISTVTTGSPALAHLLAEKIPVEELPVVIGKLQMAYDLFSLLSIVRKTLKLKC